MFQAKRTKNISKIASFSGKEDDCGCRDHKDQASTKSALTRNLMLNMKVMIDATDQDLLRVEVRIYGWCRGTRPVSGLYLEDRV